MTVFHAETHLIVLLCVESHVVINNKIKPDSRAHPTSYVIGAREELYLHSPIHLHSVVLIAQEQPIPFYSAQGIAWL
jgi:hypothetical protein